MSPISRTIPLLIWSALWWAQLVHLGLVVALPLVLAVARASLGVVLLPFFLAGPGDVNASLGRGLGHLGQASCWVALLPCSLAERSLWEPKASPVSPASAPAGAGAAPAEREPLLPLPSAFTLRHLWFALWLLWFAVFLLRRERGGARGQRAGE